MIKFVGRAAYGFAIRPTSAYAHAASPPAEPADTSAPHNFEDPLKRGVVWVESIARRP
ncbi:hypothetical protein FRAHR75_160009 [Frankia sp. Hr75.2]|nr:hypothetical protein FRAHR75_160009 [Frankia sp. Hr75.2]